MRAITTADGAISISSPVISPSASPSIVASSPKSTFPEILVPLLMQDEIGLPGSAIESHPSSHRRFISLGEFRSSLGLEAHVQTGGNERAAAETFCQLQKKAQPPKLDRWLVYNIVG